MILLFDQGFPQHISDYGEVDFALVRWSGEQVNDEDLLSAAARDKVDGVIFLGLQPLADGRLAALGDKLGLHVAATHDTEPMQALRAITFHLPSLKRMIHPGGVSHIFMSEVRDVRRAGQS